MLLNTILDTLPTRAQKQFTKSMIGALNASIIGNVRGHIRHDPLEQAAYTEGQLNIDIMNEALAAIGESNARNQAMINTGLDPIMPSIEIAQHLMTIRSAMAEFLEQNKSTEFDVPLTVANTVKFQLERAPTVNESRLKALAKALNKDYDLLKRIQIESFQQEREAFSKVAGQVLTIVDTLEDSGDDDEAFESLPAHVRYKLAVSAIKALDKAGEEALKQLLRFNKMDGATDHTLIEAVKKNCIAWLIKFEADNSHELDAYVERGGMLPEFNQPPVASPDTILTA